MHPEPADTVDAVVIGAGPNGLVAANLLADAGWDVLVLEAADQVGGAARSAELMEPGFVNDLCSAFYPLGAASPILAGLDLSAYGLRWRHAPLVVAHLMPDDRCAAVSRSLDETAASVSAFDPGDGDRWRVEYGRWRHLRDDLVDAMFTPFPPVRPAARLLRNLGVAEAMRFARMVTMPSRALGAERFRGEGARLLLEGNALHTDLGPAHGGSAIFGWLLCMLAQEVGFPAVEGGASVLTEALATRLRAAGGRIDCGRPVTSVLVADGQALGVADEQGGLVRARRAVLAAVPAPTLYEDLVGLHHLPVRLRQDIAAFHWDDATVKVDWNLSGPIPWRNEQVRLAGTVHLDQDMLGLSQFSAELTAGRVPANPFAILGQMTTTDPTRSPAGTETAWAYTHVPRGLQWTDDALRVVASGLEDLVERHAPGFRDLIRGRYVQGPMDFQRHNPNLVEGAINAGSAAIHQQLFFRPVPGLGRPDTPVDRLYLAGASAHPGGAVHGGPGAFAARAALARNGVTGPVYAKVVQALNRVVYAD
ncbi:phytoene desaturase family protein [Labedaea rhizosphaerae]|uniref:Pyridine nucleotide-disulfide oxidoreductase domain-containing protein 2 n=1 Tax=Labedaea rhizosphaerae TaxID=598644 RepID=A0A4R6S4E2_LABRH|nr:NAD(P)/FAD-dependent oxidoreductase [Labedaea rhizosphaerae]TDP94114.1 phytoene dehydrogenase-like protein [Labedaea rhizosphaerae]